MQNTNGPITASNYVAKYIRGRILSGHYQHGSRLDQKKLSEEIDVSLIPLREALRQLEVEGLVQIYPRRGAYVVKLSAESLKEIYLIRATLEELATQLGVPNLTSERIDQMARRIEQMELAVSNNDIDRLLEISPKFHFIIYEAAGRPLLMEILSNLWTRSAMYRQMYGRVPQRASRILNIHKEIFIACKAGDAYAAAMAIRKDIQQAIEDYLLMVEN